MKKSFVTADHFEGSMDLEKIPSNDIREGRKLKRKDEYHHSLTQKSSGLYALGP
jgi:hypothetical protein